MLLVKSLSAFFAPLAVGYSLLFISVWILLYGVEAVKGVLWKQLQNLPG